MTTLEFTLAAEASALAAVQAGSTPFATEQKKMADFVAVAQPDTQWAPWNQIFQQAVQRYGNAAQRDKAPVAAARPVIPGLTAPKPVAAAVAPPVAPAASAAASA
jgi:hypothetical protein